MPFQGVIVFLVTNHDCWAVFRVTSRISLLSVLPKSRT